MIVGHFDAAHMLAPMPVASTLGLGHLTRAHDGTDGTRSRRQRDHRVRVALAGALRTVALSLGADPAQQGAALRARRVLTHAQRVWRR